MRITLFGVEEANRLLTDIRPKLEKLRAQKHELDRIETRLAVLDVATNGADAANPDAIERAEFGGKRRRLGELIGKELAELGELGVMVKDLDAGLCDFYALMGDRLVFLCWRLDESEVGHWHTLDAGFSGRRPLRKAERE